ncbi:MAG: M14 family metallopeptidase [Phycisphaerae bacterium]|nr:M14 family metallopeptidase [Phycisphaerae bacterium]
MKLARTVLFLLAVAVAPLSVSSTAFAQQQLESKVPIAFDRYYDHEELIALFHALAAAYPEFASMKQVSTSVRGEPIWVMTINNPRTGADTAKPAMWIDGNIHGNEIQAGEVVLYTAWYLLSAYGKVPALTDLLDHASFYLVPSMNPDGRIHWFAEPNTSSSSRGGVKPTDNDRDGLLDEDGPDDINGDGSIGVMWRMDPNGTHRRSELDPNRMEPISAEPLADGTVRRGDWSFAGSEGIDNDGDGQVNEDGIGGYDPNRNWPADWQPNHVQDGAGEIPLSLPESQGVAEFVLAHPNIAAGQSYHNAGGMILRGPGAQDRESAYGARDRATYDAIATAGEEMLPFYRKMVIWSDLYPVRGGFVNWLAESLGIVAFTNELWSDNRILQSGSGPNEEQTRRWRERVLFAQTIAPLKEVDHPTYGRVLVGGGTKYSGRIPPPFMVQEEHHRNFAFTMFHAAQMPRLRFASVATKDVGSGLWQIDVEVANNTLIPTRIERASSNGIGQPDRLTINGVDVVLAGSLENRFDRTINEQRYRPATLENDAGIPGRGSRFFRFIVKGTAGASIDLRYSAAKAATITTSVPLTAPAEEPAAGELAHDRGSR